MSLAQYFSLVDVQARMSLRADASRYFLGYIWWVLEPLLYVAVFYIVFDIILESRKDDYLMFLMCGKLSFVWFSQTVNKASESIVNAKSLIGKINAPKALFPMAVVQEGLYKQIAVFLLLFTVLWLFGYTPNLTWMWLLPVLLVNYVVIVACALIGAYIVCIVRDFARLVSLGMVFLMFTSGVFWDVHALGDPEKVNLVLAINPIAFMLDTYRQVLMHHTAPNMEHLLIIGAVFGFLLALISWLMNRQSKYIALKVLTS